MAYPYMQTIDITPSEKDILIDATTMNEPYKHYSESKGSNAGHILWNSIYMKCLEMSNLETKGD